MSIQDFPKGLPQLSCNVSRRHSSESMEKPVSVIMLSVPQLVLGNCYVASIVGLLSLRVAVGSLHHENDNACSSNQWSSMGKKHSSLS